MMNPGKTKKRNELENLTRQVRQKEKKRLRASIFHLKKEKIRNFIVISHVSLNHMNRI